MHNYRQHLMQAVPDASALQGSPSSGRMAEPPPEQDVPTVVPDATTLPGPPSIGLTDILTVEEVPAPLPDATPLPNPASSRRTKPPPVQDVPIAVPAATVLPGPPTSGRTEPPPVRVGPTFVPDATSLPGPPNGRQTETLSKRDVRTAVPDASALQGSPSSGRMAEPPPVQDVPTPAALDETTLPGPPNIRLADFPPVREVPTTVPDVTGLPGPPSGRQTERRTLEELTEVPHATVPQSIANVASLGTRLESAAQAFESGTRQDEDGLNDSVSPELSPKISPVQDTQSLDPVLSSWRTLIDRLSKAIDRVEELTCDLPHNQHPTLVRELRSTLQKHKDRYKDFVQLSKEYADRYLEGLSDEIRSQGEWLDLLERRLDHAKTIRREAVVLKEEFEEDVCHELKSVCGLSAPVKHHLRDEGLYLKELKDLIDNIKACYIELDKFWLDEVRHVLQALKDHRIERGEVDRWRNIGDAMQSAFEPEPPPALSAPMADIVPQPELRVTQRRVPQRRRDIPEIVSALIPTLHATTEQLRSARKFKRTCSTLKPKDIKRLGQAYTNLERHKSRCVKFLQRSLDYVQDVVNISHFRPSVVCETATSDLHVRAMALTAAGPIVGGIDVLSFVSGTIAKHVKEALQKVQDRLREGERIWESIVRGNGHIFAMLLMNGAEGSGTTSSKRWRSFKARFLSTVSKSGDEGIKGWGIQHKRVIGQLWKEIEVLDRFALSV
ncbi:hypothetical protein FA95DRAFT_1575825 [Auriscalpium vulgare]|uniref:Uncharacterized protein n=1 Tax=Auriscalpium vulgare TaxID=40419 RepID=A0ACB8REI0_9AGAM|nr:hypothetical protein FA95DRAFT_1575825 [Auriscalpium vulgare]